MALGAFPTMIVELGFGSGPNVDYPAWTDVTRWATKTSIRRGRQHELGRFEAGRAIVEFDNSDGRFSTFNTTSPWYPNVKTGVQIRISAVWSGTTYRLYRGVVEAFTLKWTGANGSTVTATCADALKLLNAKKAATLSVYQATVLADTPSVYYRLGDPPGATAVADSSGNGNTGTLTAGTFGAAGLLVAAADTAFDPGQRSDPSLGSPGYISLPVGLNLNSANAFSVECWIQPRTTTGSVDTIFTSHNGAQTVNLDVNNDGTLSFQVFDGTNGGTTSTRTKVNDGKPHHVVAAWTGAGHNAQVAVDGIQDFSVLYSPAPVFNTNSISFGFGMDGFFDEIAVYQTTNIVGTKALAHYNAGAFPLAGQTSGARVTAFLDAVGQPTALRAIDTGLSTLQAVDNTAITKSALANLQDVADTEGGALFVDATGYVTFFDRTHTSRIATYNTVQTTLGDSGVLGTEEPFLVDTTDLQSDDLDVWTTVIVTPLNQGPQVATDATAVAAYGDQTLTRGSLTNSNPEAAGQAQWLLNLYKTPRDRIGAVKITPLSDPNVLFPAMLGNDLLTRVQLIRRPKDGASSTFTQTALIEGIEHDITKGALTATWRLSPADAVAATMFILDNAVSGVLDTSRLGY